ncbi:MAG: hypothetical protein AAF393_00680 [Pseudomonadota bacterium]
MGLSRRAVLMGTAAVIGGTVLIYLRRPGGFHAFGRDVILKAYGTQVDDPAVEEFLAEAKVYLDRETQKTSLTLYAMDGAFGIRPGGAPELWLQAWLVHQFAMSTTVVAAMENSEPVEFVALYDPLDAVCANQLTANYA